MIEVGNVGNTNETIFQQDWFEINNQSYDIIL